MKTNIVSILVAVVLAIAAGWFAARFTSDSIDRETVQLMLREAGDSAVVAYRSSSELEDFVSAALADTIDHYNAEVQAATKIVVRRQTVTIHDTVPAPQPIAMRGDTATVELPPKTENGVTLADTLEVSPPPDFLLRHGTMSFEPDTVIAALLRTEDGIDRFTAAMVGEGFQVSIADAATLRPKRETTFDRIAAVLTAGSCLVAGWALGSDDAPKAALYGASATCGTGLLKGLLKR